MPLTGKQRRYLRSLGHHLQPVVQLGKEGPSEGVVGALDSALQTHELVKVKLAESDGRDEVADQLARATKSEVAQILGRTLLLYRRRKKDPAIKLPRAEG